MVNQLLQDSIYRNGSRESQPSIFRTHFQVPYAATLLFACPPWRAALTKTPGGMGVLFPFRNMLRAGPWTDNDPEELTTDDAGRPARRQFPCGEVHPHNTFYGGHPIPRCLRGFLSSAK